MKLIIDIPKEAFELVKNNTQIDFLDAIHIISIIQNGTPLEEELEKIKAELIGICNHCNCVSCVFVSLEDEKCLMKTIINNHISELKGETHVES